MVPTPRLDGPNSSIPGSPPSGTGAQQLRLDILRLHRQTQLSIVPEPFWDSPTSCQVQEQSRTPLVSSGSRGTLRISPIFVPARISSSQLHANSFNGLSHRHPTSSPTASTASLSHRHPIMFSTASPSHPSSTARLQIAHPRRPLSRRLLPRQPLPRRLLPWRPVLGDHSLGGPSLGGFSHGSHSLGGFSLGGHSLGGPSLGSFSHSGPAPYPAFSDGHSITTPGSCPRPASAGS